MCNSGSPPCSLLWCVPPLLLEKIGSKKYPRGGVTALSCCRRVQRQEILRINRIAALVAFLSTPPVGKLPERASQTTKASFRPIEPFHTSDRWSVWSVWSVWYVWSVWSVWSIPATVHDLDLCNPDLYDLAHVYGWERYNLHDLGQVSWVGSVLFRSCTTYHSDRLLNSIYIWSRSWSIWSIWPVGRVTHSKYWVHLLSTLMMKRG